MSPKEASSTAAASLRSLAKQPLRFEENVGQHASTARFVAQRSGAKLLLDNDGVTLSLRSPGDAKKSIAPATASLKLRVAGAKNVEPRASELLPTKTNYLRGKDKSNWRTNVANYGRVTYPGVLDGVDLVYHGEEGQMEYDFNVAPGADASKIVMNIEGGDGLTVDADGNLVIALGERQLVQQRPRVFQRDAQGKTHHIAASYRLAGTNGVTVALADYDHSRELVIDPVIGYSTFLGTASGYETAAGVKADAQGNAFIVGTAAANNFANANTIELCEVDPERCGGQSPGEGSSGRDVWVAKLTDSGTLAYFTYVIGESEDDDATAIALWQGLPVVTGGTRSYDFPTTDGSMLDYDEDTFLFGLTSGGDDLLFSTLVGVDHMCPDVERGAPMASPQAIEDYCGSEYPLADRGTSLAILGNQAYIGGRVDYGDLRVSPLAVIAPPLGGSITEVTLGGPAATTTTNFRSVGGESVEGVAVDASHVYLTGTETGYEGGALVDQTLIPPTAFMPTNNVYQAAYIIKLNRDADLTSAWGTYYGSNSGESSASVVSYALALAEGGTGRVFLGGGVNCESDNGCDGLPPFSPNAFQKTMGSMTDAFVASFDTTVTGAASLKYATLLGGGSEEYLTAIAVDNQGHAYVTGYTYSQDFPTLPPAAAVGDDTFVTELDTDGSKLLFSVLFGGSSRDRAHGLDWKATGVYIAGETTSDESSFPTSPDAAQPAPAGSGRSAFAAKLRVEPLTLTPSSITLQAGQQQTFTANGGAGGSYAFDMQSAPSGGSINSGTGVYTAGTSAGTDIVRVADVLGNIATATVSVVNDDTRELIITPSAGDIRPRGTLVFSATGGSPPYTFTYAVNGSNGSVSGNGTYVAGPRGNVTDIVRVTDSANRSRTASVRVGSGVVINPQNASVPARGTQVFSATGGTGGPYTWTASNGTINNTGTYTAPGTAGSAVVTARDTFGNTASVNVSIGGALVIAPGGGGTHPRGVLTFTPVGGTKSGYQWALATTPPAGGSINQLTGVFTAGERGDVTEILQLRDSSGTVATAEIRVGPAVSITPSKTDVAANTNLTFSAAGGSGLGYVFALSSTQSGASIVVENGLYTSGPKGGLDVVTVVDSVGNVATAEVNAAAAPPAPEGSSSGAAGASSGAAAAPNQGIGRIGVGSGGGGDDGCSVVNVSTSGGSRMSGAGLLLVGSALLVRRRRRTMRR